MKKIKLSDETYDVLKWVCLIVIPAVTTFISTLAIIWGWNIPIKQIDASMAAVDTLLGILLGISCYNYNKDIDTDKEV